MDPPKAIWNVPDLFYALTTIAKNPSDLHWFCKEMDGFSGGGTFPLVSLRLSKFCRVFDRQPYYEALTGYDKIREAIAVNNALIKTHAVQKTLFGIQISFYIFDSIYKAPLGVVPLPNLNEQPKEIHSVAIVPWGANQESLRFVNSWGAGWGDKGYGTISREYLDKHLVEAWIGRNCRVGPTRHTSERLFRAVKDKEFSETWLLNNPRGKTNFRHNGTRHQFLRYETISIEYGRPLIVFEIRNGFGLRLAWMHLIVMKPDAPFLITELYVFPSFRRLGYGSILESVGSDWAKHWSSDKIQIQFQEADAQLSLRAAGRNFAEKRGYIWKWRTVQYPRLVAIGEKKL